MKSIKFFALLLILSVCFSCNTNKKTDNSNDKVTGDMADKHKSEISPSSFIDIKWNLNTINGEVIESGAFVMFSSNENKVSGNSSCNNYNGSYKITNKNTVEFSPFAMTRMACPDMKTESSLMSILQETATLSLDSGILEISNNVSKSIATFKSDSK